MKIALIVLGISLILGCNENRRETQIVYRIIYKENPLAVEDTILNRYTDTLPIFEYHYSDSSHIMLMDWLDPVLKKYRDSLINKKLLVQKSYFLSKIQLQNEEKVLNIQKFNQSVEEMLSISTGTYQGIPSVVFSTSIVSLEDTDMVEEALVIKLNRFMYNE